MSEEQQQHVLIVIYDTSQANVTM